uniref:Uncharacterized protein n=1 Tax=Anguilla anguilla TaxID=7936 RepID=A0A0E9TCY8_ANGAN
MMHWQFLSLRKQWLQWPRYSEAKRQADRGSLIVGVNLGIAFPL